MKKRHQHWGKPSNLDLVGSICTIIALHRIAAPLRGAQGIWQNRVTGSPRERANPGFGQDPWVQHRAGSPAQNHEPELPAAPAVPSTQKNERGITAVPVVFPNLRGPDRHGQTTGWLQPTGKAPRKTSGKTGLLHPRLRTQRVQGGWCLRSASGRGSIAGSRSPTRDA